MCTRGFGIVGVLTVALAAFGTPAYSQDVGEIQEEAQALSPTTASTFTYLVGTGWGESDATQDVLTVEYVSDWGWGDGYFFFEVYDLLGNAGEDQPRLYMEWHPRGSLSSLFGRPLSRGPIGDVMAAAEINVADGFTAMLYGLGVDWVMPAGSWLLTNVYVRDDRALEGRTWQVLTAGGTSIDLGGPDLKVFGYLDTFGAEGSRGAVVYGELQLLIDVGTLGGRGSRGLFAGVELHTSREAGGPGWEVVPQAVVQWTF